MNSGDKDVLYKGVVYERSNFPNYGLITTLHLIIQWDEMINKKHWFTKKNISAGNNPMVGKTVAVVVAIEETNKKASRKNGSLNQ